MKGTTCCVNEPAGAAFPEAVGAFLSAPVNGASGRKRKPALSKQSRRRVQRNGIASAPDGTSSWSWGRAGNHGGAGEAKGRQCNPLPYYIRGYFMWAAF